MSIKQFAQNELDRLVKGDDPMQREVNKDIMAIVELFASQGHSRFSAGYTIGVLDRLLNFHPLTPLTGEDDEWGTLGGSIQNHRCSSVFKDSDGAYDIDAVTTHYAGDSACFCAQVRYNVRFPYMPSEKNGIRVTCRSGKLVVQKAGAICDSASK